VLATQHEHDFVDADVALHEHDELLKFKLLVVTLLDTQLQFVKLVEFPTVKVPQEQDCLVEFTEQLMEAILNRSFDAQQLHTLALEFVGSQ
jgi:hypothetical protein